MKKVIAAGLIAGSLCLVTPASAQPADFNDAYDDALMHPLRLAYYVIHPMGYAAEWLVGRPFQYIISRDGVRNIFGYKPLDETAAYGMIENDI